MNVEIRIEAGQFPDKEYSCSVLLSIQKWFFLPGEQADDCEGPVGPKGLQGCQHRREDLGHKEHDPTR